MGIDPKSASVTPETIEQWMKDNPTIISKKSIHNIKTCLINNCNVTILIDTYGPFKAYGHICSLYESGQNVTFVVQYFNALDNEVRYLTVSWHNNEFFVSDYKFD